VWHSKLTLEYSGNSRCAPARFPRRRVTPCQKTLSDGSRNRRDQSKHCQNRPPGHLRLRKTTDEITTTFFLNPTACTKLTSANEGQHPRPLSQPKSKTDYVVGSTIRWWWCAHVHTKPRVVRLVRGVHSACQLSVCMRGGVCHSCSINASINTTLCTWCARPATQAQ
jgi:hypothetical protein